jgi:D,D-heptose 1,7-bisphosphate phosphatase
MKVWGSQVPKPMLQLAGKTILDHQLFCAQQLNISHVLLLVEHQAEVIIQHFAAHRYPQKIEIFREEQPLGTGGALRAVASHLNEDFLVFYGDTIMDIDLSRLLAFHQQRGPLATLLVHPNDHPYDSDLVELDAESRVRAFHPKPHGETPYRRNVVNAALYMLSPRIFPYIEAGVFSDLGKDIFPRLLAAGETIAGYATPEYIKDIGTPERFRHVEEDVISGKVARRNLRHKRPAIFIDRDGVLNRERGSAIKAGEFELLAGVPEALGRINRSDYLAVVITNQPGIAKGEISEKELADTHAKMDTLFGTQRVFIDRLYYCPHHPDRGFVGERSAYKMPCACRKPGIAMLQQAALELNIDMERSFFIGDRSVDVMTGINAGTRTVLVRSGFGGSDGKFPCQADYSCADFSAAVSYILDTTYV